jgi:hypothetical protein
VFDIGNELISFFSEFIWSNELVQGATASLLEILICQRLEGADIISILITNSWRNKISGSSPVVGTRFIRAVHRYFIWFAYCLI